MKRTPFAYFYVGRSYLRPCGYEVALSFWPRPNPPIGEYAYRVNMEFYFTLPTLRLWFIRR